MFSVDRKRIDFGVHMAYPHLSDYRHRLGPIEVATWGKNLTYFFIHVVLV